MSDLNLQTNLTANAGSLNAALREGTAGVQSFAEAGKKANSELAGAAGAEAAAVASKKAATAATMAQREAMRAATAEANQLKQAYRQLPMQITDITTSLVGGMPAWQVAIQQGGQLKDSFGGIRPAGEALIGLLTPMRLVLGGVAAGVAAVTLAHQQGAAEAQAYTRAMVMSGNAAGVTRGQLDGMAQSIDKVVGTQSAAASAIALIVDSGRVAGQNVEQVATTAIKMQREMGLAVADTVAEFAALGKDPVAASVRLNDQYHYLTKSVYDQIKALQERNRFEEAADVAQRAYATAQAARTEELKANLGTVEKAWRGVKDIAAEAWDAMLGIGRKVTPQAQLETAKIALEQFDKPGRKSDDPVRDEQRRAAIKQRIADLQLQIYMEGEVAAKQQAQAADVDKHIRTDAERDRIAAANADANIQAVKSRLAAMAGAYSDAQRIMDATRAEAGVSEGEYYASKRALIELDRRAQVAALAEENRILAGKKALGADAVARDAQIAGNKAEAARTNAKAAADIVVANAQEAASYTTLARAQADYWLALQRGQEARERANARDLGGAAQGDKARDAAKRLAEITDKFQADMAKATDDRNGGRITGAVYRERLAALQAYHDQALASEQAFQDAKAAVEANADVGMQRAYANYAESARNVAKYSEEAWTRAFQGMEDSMVSFITTGKGGFSALANSIVADLIRIQIRQQMVQASGSGGWLNAIIGAFTGGSSGGAGSDIGGGFQGATVFHGGGVVGRESGQGTRYFPAGAFDSAPRYHTGFLAPREKLAVLQDDESVLTPGQMRAMGSAGRSAPNITMPLTVINQTGTPAQAQARQKPDGGIELLLTAVKDSMANDIASGVGPVTGALRGRFGLRDKTS